MFLPRITALSIFSGLRQSAHNVNINRTHYADSVCHKLKRKEGVLEIFEIVADLKPLSRIPRDVIGVEESGDDCWNPSAMLKEPISLQYASGRTRTRWSLLQGLSDYGDLREIGQC